MIQAHFLLRSFALTKNIILKQEFSMKRYNLFIYVTIN